MGQQLVSNNGMFCLNMQNDGNLVIYTFGGTALWSSKTNNKPRAYAVMQHDGNFVIYLGSKALWSTKTNGDGASYAVIQDDCNFVLYTSKGKAVWSSKTILLFGDDILTAVKISISRGLNGQRVDNNRAYVKFKGHEFWIHTVGKQTINNNMVRYKVQISHIVKGVDEQRYLTVPFINGVLFETEIKVKDKNGGIINNIVTPALCAVGSILGGFTTGFVGGTLGAMAGKVTADEIKAIQNKIVGNWMDVLEIITTIYITELNCMSK